MANISDHNLIQGQLHVTSVESAPEILGRGPAKILGASYFQGPNLIGGDKSFPTIWATTMFGPLSNSQSPLPSIPGHLSFAGAKTNNSPYSLAVNGDAAIFNNLDVNGSISARSELVSSGSIKAQGTVESHCGVHKLHKKKNFDIPHPTKEGWRLTHTCIEGPEAAVYFRGRITKQTEINLPEYWANLVDVNSITVSLTPIGNHQNIFVKTWDISKIYLESDIEIDCFYHVYGERIDTEKLIPEYKGSIENYPGDNSQRSIAGYHYDVEES